jgi:hypothetical protein
VALETIAAALGMKGAETWTTDVLRGGVLLHIAALKENQAKTP